MKRDGKVLQHFVVSPQDVQLCVITQGANNHMNSIYVLSERTTLYVLRAADVKRVRLLHLK